MGNCKPVIENFLTICISLRVWTWLNSLHHNCHIHYDHEKLARTCTVGIVSGLLILLFSPSDSNADMPMGGLQQRIGNYDVSVKTDPPQPQTGTTVKILMAVAAVNGDDISGIPADITIKGDGSVLSGLNRPIAIPYGHYTYQYEFEKPGIYSLVVDIYDIYFTGRQVSFTFPIEVKSTFFGLWGASDMMGYILVPSIVIIVSIVLALIIWQKHKTKLKDSI
jgi:fumarate reductase subunit D